MSTMQHWLWLSSRGPSAGMYANRLLEHFGTPSAAFFADEKEYEQIEDLPPGVRWALLDKDLTKAEKIWEDCQRLGIQILTVQDASYPHRLRQLETAPCVLYLRGRLPRVDQEAAVAVVGARKASGYGIRMAEELARDMTLQGALIVSGSAKGVDAAALRGAMKAGGQVISVLGNGVDVVYPAENWKLYEEAADKGALLSEYPPGTRPAGRHFPVRNRIIAGLCLGTLVVEGGAGSGSLITARWALEQNRDVFAVPGNVGSELSVGPNSLIRQGEAKLVMNAWDILEEYEHLYPTKLRQGRKASEGKREKAYAKDRPPRKDAKKAAPKPRQGKSQFAKAPEPAQPPQEKEREAAVVLDLKASPELLTQEEAALLRALQGGGRYTPDDLVGKTNLPARQVLSTLTMLQLRQLVREDVGRKFFTEVELQE